MSRRINVAPAVVTGGGALVVNTAGFAAARDVSELIARALDDNAELFIGTAGSNFERELPLERLDNAATDAVAKIDGKRCGR